MPPELIGLLAQGGANVIGSLISGITGAHQKKLARKWLNNNPQPQEQMPTDVLENKRLATQMAATGLPSEQYNMAMRNIQRQQQSALRGAQDRRSAVGAISAIQQNANDATANLDAKNAEMRIANQKNLLNINSQTAKWRDLLFNKNVLQPYEKQWNYNMGLLGAGNQNVTNALDQGAAGLGQIGYGLGLFGGGKNRKQSAGYNGGGGQYTYNPAYGGL